MLRQTLFRLSQHRHLHQIATSNRAARKVASRFVAGETLDEALDVVRGVNQHGMSATLDHLGENVANRAEAAEAADAYIRTLREIRRTELDSNVSLKLSHMGIDLDESFAFENAGRVIATAAETSNFVRIDMESSEYVDRTFDFFYRYFQEWKEVGVVLQAYLYRTKRDLEGLLEADARVRLVKGAYLEPASVAFQSKAEVDANFIRLTRTLLQRGTFPAIATHDPHMIEATIRMAREEGIESSRYEFQMLYGIRRDLQNRLVREGYAVRIYIPYGNAWYPYLMRRMAERPANVMFVLGNVAREAVARKPNGRRS